MDKKLHFKKGDILEKKFTPNVKGYDPDQVDDFLDLIIEDYVTFEKFINELQKYVANIEEADGKLKKKIRSLEVECDGMRQRLAGIKEGDKPTAENIGYIQRINQLEQICSRNGIDPKTGKPMISK